MTSGVNGTGGGTAGVGRPVAHDLPGARKTGSGQAASRSGALSAPIAKNMPSPVVRSEMRGIARDIAAQPPVDVAKVERLSQLVNAGTYKVDAGRIADAMIASERTR